MRVLLTFYHIERRGCSVYRQGGRIRVQLDRERMERMGMRRMKMKKGDLRRLSLC